MSTSGVTNTWRKALCVGLLALMASAEVAKAVPNFKKRFSSAAFPAGGPKEFIKRRYVNRNIETVKSFYNTIRQEWAPDIRGQITPLGVYENFNKSSEYWVQFPALLLIRSSYALGLNPFAGGDFVRFEGSQFVSLYGAGNMVNSKFQAFIKRFSDNSTIGTFFQEGTFFFNRDGKICGYDIEARHFDAVATDVGGPLSDSGRPPDELINAVPDANPSKARYLPRAGTRSILEEICEVAVGEACQAVGKVFYRSKKDCMRKLGKKRIGANSNIDRDTLSCRALHRLLVPSNPEVHCPHLAANLPAKRGGVCIDRSSAVHAARNFQCGYDDVGYEPAVPLEP